MASKNNDVYEKVRLAVHFQWDSIGITAYSQELGEYDSYIPELCKLLADDSSDEQRIFEFLWEIETKSMGLNGEQKVTREFASTLCRLIDGCN